MKCIYGLKQASREWQLLLDSFLLSYSFNLYQAKDGIGIYVSFADPRGFPPPHTGVVSRVLCNKLESEIMPWRAASLDHRPIRLMMK